MTSTSVLERAFQFDATGQFGSIAQIKRRRDNPGHKSLRCSDSFKNQQADSEDEGTKTVAA